MVASSPSAGEISSVFLSIWSFFPEERLDGVHSVQCWNVYVYMDVRWVGQLELQDMKGHGSRSRKKRGLQMTA